ncbi:MAG: response regulator [Bdellovibrionaceae bacterium]|nr:response regulator [Pseudobdellovibrionaceae bacterium]
MKVLVIDDEAVIRRSIQRAGEKKGHEVYLAENGSEGLAIWSKANPDVVFLDVLMPGLTGPDVLKQRDPNSKAKVVLISAYTGEYNLERAQEHGADLFIGKPFADIFAVIQQAEDLVGK